MGHGGPAGLYRWWWLSQHGRSCECSPSGVDAAALVFPPASALACPRARGVPTQSPLASPCSKGCCSNGCSSNGCSSNGCSNSHKGWPLSLQHPWVGSYVPRHLFQGDGLVGAPGLMPANDWTKGAGQTDRLPTLNNATSELPEAFISKIVLVPLSKRLQDVSGGGVGCSGGWDDFGFAEEHLGPGGRSGAAAPGRYFQPSSGSAWEPVAAFR